MTVLVCGGRDQSYRLGSIVEFLDAFHATKMITKVVCGGAAGVDKIAFEWALRREINFSVYPAKWRRYGNLAGPARNLEMVLEEKVDAVIAFSGDQGTDDMMEVARCKNIPIVMADQK